MPNTTITRATLNDDTGDGESGDVLTAALIGSAIYDKVDALFSSASGLNSNGAITERSRAAAMGEWEAFVVTWTNLTVGNGTVTARYSRVGKTIHFRVYLLFGSTTSVAGAVGFSLPQATTAAVGSVSGSHGCAANYRDSSAATVYRGEGRVASTTTVNLFDNANPTAAVTSTVPFIWATGDSMSLVGSIEEA